MGRFLNADAFASTGQGLLGNNMFAYCNNNPVVNVDGSGNAPYPCTVAYKYGGRRTYITDQDDDPVGSFKFGITNVSHGGCGVIASYNALITLGTPKNFKEVLDYYNNHMALVPGKGLFGLSPGMIAGYFRDLGFHVTMTNSPDLIDLYSTTASASILYYQFPATYLGVEAYGAHFVAYQKVGKEYTGYNTAENNGVFSFQYPSDYGYAGIRYYTIGIFIY